MLSYSGLHINTIHSFSLGNEKSLSSPARRKAMLPRYHYAYYKSPSTTGKINTPSRWPSPGNGGTIPAEPTTHHRTGFSRQLRGELHPGLWGLSSTVRGSLHPP